MRKKAAKKEIGIDKKPDETPKSDEKPASKPTAMTDKEMFYIVLILALIGIIIYLFVTSGFKAEKDKIMADIKTELGQKGGQKLGNYTGSLPALGDSNAPISFIEFGDYQCPFCAKFYNEVESFMILKHVNTSKVKFYYRDLPQAEIHDKAMLASHTTRCANEQGKFWEMHTKLYKNHNSWSVMGVASAKQRFQDYADELELDITKLNDCVNSEKYKNEISLDMQDAARLGISGTPTFVVQIPKDKTTLENVQKVRSAVRGTTLVQQEDKYTIIIVGARTYNDFKAFFDLVP